MQSNSMGGGRQQSQQSGSGSQQSGVHYPGLMQWQHQRQQQQGWSGAGEQNVGSSERIVSTGLGGLLVANGILRGRLPGLLMTAIGGALIYRGVTGSCALYQQLGINTSSMEGERAITKGVKIEESVTIRRPAQELYDAWTRWEQLPQILPHIEHVKDLGHGRTRWTARGPLGASLSWDAEVINQDPGRMVAWQSIAGGDVDTAGSVHFDAINDNTTRMTVSMQYQPPGGRLTAVVAEFLGIGLDRRAREDLQRFKRVMESGSQVGTQGAHAATDVDSSQPGMAPGA